MSHRIICLALFSLLPATSAFAAAGGVAEGFGFEDWAERIHIFWIALILMTGGSITYGVLLRRKQKRLDKE